MTESVQIQNVLSDLNNFGWHTHDIYYYKQEVDLESKRSRYCSLPCWKTDRIN